GNFRIDLVSRDFKQRLVALDLVAWLLQPFGDCSFKNTFAHLGHYDIYSHGYLLGSTLNGTQTFLVPHSWNTFEGIDLVAAMKETYFLHFRHTGGKVELLRFELIVI